MHNKNINERISYLAKKWQEGTITSSEKEEFDKWYNHFDDSLLEFEKEDDLVSLKERIFDSINRDLNSPNKKLFFQSPFFRIAASILIILMPLGLFWKYHSNKKPDVTAISKNEITPGGQKAILILSDGSKVILDEKSSEPLLKVEGAEIDTKHGRLVYASKQPYNPNTPVYHTIQIPKGGTYQLNLPDGTRVWLNAASSLRYPVNFKQGAREVELSGEAYFEVAKDKKRPFIVKSEKLSVEVLGTHFNLNAYEDESEVKTTLFEGKVRILRSAQSTVLYPMQQAILTTSNKALKINKINSKEAVSWKDGDFTFDNEAISTVMKKISRWYDVEIVYRGEIPNHKYVGKISRYENVSEILKMLSLTKTIHFEIEGRRIIVML